MNKFIWSTEQNDIFEWFRNGSGNIVVEAFAGAAKTSTIEEGIKHAPENKILYSVFGKRNQTEAMEKIKDPRTDIKTLHSLGFSYLKTIWPKCKATPFAEMNRIKNVAPDFPEDVIFIPAKLISFLKNLYLNPTLENAKEIMEERSLELYGDFKVWNDRLPQIAMDVIKLSETPNKLNEISFEDMLYLPHKLNLITPKYELLIADESQDLNLPQMEMVVKAAKPSGRICFVGDARQSIFGFRGTLQNGMEIFKKKLNAKTYPLTITFRCPRAVVERARRIVPDYKAADFAKDGIVETMDYAQVINSIKINDALLSRTNAPLLPIVLKLLRQKKPAYIQGREVVKQLAALVNSFEATDIYDFGNKLQAWHDTRVNLANNGKNAQRKIDLIKEQFNTLKFIADDCLTSQKTMVEDIINTINSIFFDSDYVKRPSVICSSIHRAKGLEWDTVYLLNDTLHISHPKQTALDKLEEVNLEYVGISRAKNRLVIVNGLGQQNNNP